VGKKKWDNYPKRIKNLRGEKNNLKTSPKISSNLGWTKNKNKELRAFKK